MNIPPGALLFLVFGIFDIAAGLWAYLGPPEEHGAPRGYKNMGRTWHARGAICAAIPAGVFFMMLGLATIEEDDTLRRLFLYVGGIALLTALLFLFRAPLRIRPAWLREPPPKPESTPQV
jgi:hypothetical protein